MPCFIDSYNLINSCRGVLKQAPEENNWVLKGFDWGVEWRANAEIHGLKRSLNTVRELNVEDFDRKGM